MWVARSGDDGATFDTDSPILPNQTGACACCGTRSLVTRDGTLLLLYRAAKAGVQRDMTLLASSDHGQTFRAATVDRWNLNACPMSSATMAEGPSGVLAAWETQGQVYSALVAPKTLTIDESASPPGEAGGRKHPAIACNPQGEMLLAWTEGTGWQKGGSLAWQLYDAERKPVGPEGRKEGAIPTWSLATVVAGPDGGFTILY